MLRLWFLCHVTPHSLVDGCNYPDDASMRFLQNAGIYLHGAPSQMTVSTERTDFLKICDSGWFVALELNSVFYKTEDIF